MPPHQPNRSVDRGLEAAQNWEGGLSCSGCSDSRHGRDHGFLREAGGLAIRECCTQPANWQACPVDRAVDSGGRRGPDSPKRLGPQTEVSLHPFAVTSVAMPSPDCL